MRWPGFSGNQPVGEHPESCGAPPRSTLPARLRAAADTLEELSALIGVSLSPRHTVWTADELRIEATELDRTTPQ